MRTILTILALTATLGTQAGADLSKQFYTASIFSDVVPFGYGEIEVSFAFSMQFFWHKQGNTTQTR
mgnify:CR=1 FL=1